MNEAKRRSSSDEANTQTREAATRQERIADEQAATPSPAERMTLSLDRMARDSADAVPRAELDCKRQKDSFERIADGNPMSRSLDSYQQQDLQQSIDRFLDEQSDEVSKREDYAASIGT